jgi:hypothetical protein
MSLELLLASCKVGLLTALAIGSLHFGVSPIERGAWMLTHLTAIDLQGFVLRSRSDK